MITLLFFAFLAGIMTILAPCIWPLLPLLLSASSAEGKKRPLGVVSGIITSFTLFTLFLAYVLQFLPVSPDTFRTFAAVVIIVLGIVLLIPALERILEAWVSRFSGKLSEKPSSAKSTEGKDFWGGYGTGILLGMLWSPCAGPILAAVATLAATQSVSLDVIFVTLAFAFGVGIPLFIIATLGQKVFARMRAVSGKTERIRQIFGVVMIVTAFFILFGLDKTLQGAVLDSIPGYDRALYLLEDNEAVQESLKELGQ